MENQQTENQQGKYILKKGIKIFFEKQVQPIYQTFHDEYGTNVDEYEQELKQCYKFQKKYKDLNFKPIVTSLSSNNFADSGEKRKQSWGQIIWQRPEEYMPADQIQLFKGEIEPNDIKQGLLGDCYFLCALSAMTENPQLIRRLYHNQKNEHGIYSIWLNIFGEWINVVIDDLIPLKGKGPAFSRAHGPELWVILLEKAYAKIYGSYEVIEGGNPALALRDLTGAPYENLDRDSKLTLEEMAQKYWNYVTSNNKSGYIMICYTQSTQVVEEENDLGLLAGHAYSILDAKQVRDNKENPAQIFQIRNPWSRKEWKGDWSGKSNKWTQEWKKKCNLQDENDGTFWISIQDFTKYYYGIGICKVNYGYKYDSIRLDLHNTNQQLIKMTITQQSHSFVILNQKDNKFFVDHKDFSYSFLRLMIGKIQGDQFKYIGGKFIQSRELFIEYNLQPGEYIIYAEAQKCHPTLKELVLNTYSENQIKLENVVGQDADQILMQLLKSYCQTKPINQHNTKIYENNQDLIRQQFNCIPDLGILFSYYSNRTLDQILIEKITLTSIEGLDIAPPFKTTLDHTYEIQLPPNSEIVKIYKYNTSKSRKTAYASQIQYQVEKFQKNVVDTKILLQPFMNNQDLKTRKNKSAMQRKNLASQSLESKEKYFERYKFNYSDEQQPQPQAQPKPQPQPQPVELKPIENFNNIIKMENTIQILEKYYSNAQQNVDKFYQNIQNIKSDQFPYFQQNFFDDYQKIKNIYKTDIKSIDCYGLKQPNFDQIPKLVLKTFQLQNDEQSFINLEEFIIEAQQLYNISTKSKLKNIVKYHGITLRQVGKNYNFSIIQTYCEGNFSEQIKKMNDQSKIFTVNQLAKLFEEQISVLSECQLYNITHQDIKPQNIVYKIDQLTNEMYSLLADFGESSAQSSAQNTRNTRVKGTDSYLSPELLYNLKNKSYEIEYNPFKADLYSWGLTFLTIATLKKSIIRNYDSQEYNNIDPQTYDKEELIGNQNWDFVKTIKQRLQMLRDMYKNENDQEKIQKIIYLVEQCLVFNPKNRKEPIVIRDLFNSYFKNYQINKTLSDLQELNQIEDVTMKKNFSNNYQKQQDLEDIIHNLKQYHNIDYCPGDAEYILTFLSNTNPVLAQQGKEALKKYRNQTMCWSNLEVLQKQWDIAKQFNQDDNIKSFEFCPNNNLNYQKSNQSDYDFQELIQKIKELSEEDQQSSATLAFLKMKGDQIEKNVEEAKNLLKNNQTQIGVFLQDFLNEELDYDKFIQNYKKIYGDIFQAQAFYLYKTIDQNKKIDVDLWQELTKNAKYNKALAQNISTVYQSQEIQDNNQQLFENMDKQNFDSYYQYYLSLSIPSENAQQMGFIPDEIFKQYSYKYH